MQRIAKTRASDKDLVNLALRAWLDGIPLEPNAELAAAFEAWATAPHVDGPPARACAWYLLEVLTRAPGRRIGEMPLALAEVRQAPVSLPGWAVTGAEVVDWYGQRGRITRIGSAIIVSHDGLTWIGSAERFLQRWRLVVPRKIYATLHETLSTQTVDHFRRLAESRLGVLTRLTAERDLLRRELAVEQEMHGYTRAALDAVKTRAA